MLGMSLGCLTMGSRLHFKLGIAALLMAIAACNPCTQLIHVCLDALVDRCMILTKIELLRSGVCVRWDIVCVSH